MGIAPAAHGAGIPEPERSCIAAGIRSMEALGAAFWPGWLEAPMAILLVTDTAEYLLGHPAPTADFRPCDDAIAQWPVTWRPRVFPTGMQATFPAVGGVPTIVIGTLAGTGLSPPRWVTTLLHEHFHQTQMAWPGYCPGVDGLGLKGGDETGMWMLQYPFPYQDTAVGAAVDAYRTDLALALEAADGEALEAGLERCHASRDRLYGALTEPDRRYLAFQLWQEGMARCIEHLALIALGNDPSVWAGMAHLPGHQSPAEASAACWARGLEELRNLRLAEHQRVCFYAIGWAEGMLLRRIGRLPADSYFDAPFQTASWFPRPHKH